MGTNAKPDAFQMQSRFGRFCDQKYQFLMHQDDALGGASARISAKRPSFSRKQKLTPRTLDKLLASLAQRDSEKTAKPKHTHSQSHVFQVQSRDEFYQATVFSTQKRKNDAPPVGYYHPNFSPVDPTPQGLDFGKSAFKRGRVGSAKRASPEPTVIRTETLPLTKDQIDQPFTKQLPRPPMTAHASPVHEKRFDTVSDPPAISTKHRRIRSPDLKKSLARSYWKFLDTQNAPEYEPDYDQIRPKLSRNIDFDKFLSRKTLARSQSNQGVKGEVSYKQVTLRIKSPNFRKGTSRPPSEGTPLPSFMRNMTSRLGLTVPNDKALVMNNYAEAGFFIQPTSFSRPTSPLKPKTASSRAVSPQGKPLASR